MIYAIKTEFEFNFEFLNVDSNLFPEKSETIFLFAFSYVVLTYSFSYFIPSNYLSFRHSSPDRFKVSRRFAISLLQNSREFQEYTKSAIERIPTFFVLSRIGARCRGSIGKHTVSLQFSLSSPILDYCHSQDKF